jgi:hypothetical protein
VFTYKEEGEGGFESVHCRVEVVQVNVPEGVERGKHVCQRRYPHMLLLRWRDPRGENKEKRVLSRYFCSRVCICMRVFACSLGECI